MLDGIIQGVIDGIRGVERDLAEAACRASTLRSFLRSGSEIWAAYITEHREWFSVRFTGLPISVERMHELREGYERAMNVVASRARASNVERDASVVARVFAGSIFTFVLFQTRAGHEPQSAALREAYLHELVELLVAALQTGGPVPGTEGPR